MIDKSGIEIGRFAHWVDFVDGLLDPSEHGLPDNPFYCSDEHELDCSVILDERTRVVYTVTGNNAIQAVIEGAPKKP